MYQFSIMLNEIFYVSNPYDTSNCLASYGGPIEPKIALGGYPEPEEGITELIDWDKFVGIFLLK